MVKNIFVVNPKVIQQGIDKDLNYPKEIEIRSSSLYDILYQYINYRKTDFSTLKYNEIEIYYMITNIKNNIFYINSKDMIKCYINEKGQIVVVDGWYRIIIAQILKIDFIEIKILHVNNIWKEFVKYIENRKNKYLINHISFENLLSNKETIYNDIKSHILKCHIPASYFTLLDINPEWGYISNFFELNEYKCSILENDQETLNILKKIKEANNLKFDIFDFEVDSFIRNENFDVIIALKKFNFDTEENFNKIKLFFKKVNSKILFLQLNKFKKGDMKKFKKEKERINLFKKLGSYENVEIIYNNTNDSKIFKFTK